MEIVEDLLKILDGFIECPICQENYIDPTTLPCGHSYCILCISEHRKKAKTCPDCRATIPADMKDMQKSFALCNIVKAVGDHKSFVSNEVSSSNAEAEGVSTTLSTNLACDPGTSSDAHTKEQVAVPANAANAEGATGDNPPLDTDLSERLFQDLAISLPLQDDHRAEYFPPPLPGAMFTFLTFTPALGQRGLSFKTTGKVVVTKSSGGRHNVDRFRISQWLAEQQLSEGLHYWDVDTTGSMGWAVGLAYDTIGRDDRLGRTPCSWCLEGGKESLSYWHAGNEEPLKHEKPCLVRVAVDVTGGSVSFYSLTDEQTLLYCHCVHGGFSQPVRPAFWLYGLKLHNSLSFPRCNDAL